MGQEEWLKHLEEARKRLATVAVCFVLSLCAGLYAAPGLLRYLKSRPANAEIEWNVFSFTDGLMVYMKCAMLVAALFTLPVLLHQMWLFVRPGLTDREARSALPYIPAAFGLFIGGASFSYLVVFPMMLGFLQKLNQSIGASETYGIDRYFSLMFSIVFPMAIAFELPVILLFLTRIGLLTPERLRQTRKYAYVGLTIVGACISPPDMLSHLSVTIPLLLLFEISALAAGRQWRLMRRRPSGPDG
ncbi:twin-arginine translocase subunit TatC [Paenibacillus thermoaerophilus]|uniref:Sec-independent protein translocase protein TatC n=1 Tax=Paenibacillus thermoaerophilus TaxID=1215385 RepID=A0ABW2V4V9_9BACL|nr:twin-arginine translocase subunit TatC [Paenibacillus thermoaerophilus]TMV14366.1 twin-arginine translocase subunit TatC [Paenibacillus thermoaerophilus]